LKYLEIFPAKIFAFKVFHYLCIPLKKGVDLYFFQTYTGKEEKAIIQLFKPE
jgi:hypothetical protein